MVHFWKLKTALSVPAMAPVIPPLASATVVAGTPVRSAMCTSALASVPVVDNATLRRVSVNAMLASRVTIATCALAPTIAEAMLLAPAIATVVGACAITVSLALRVALSRGVPIRPVLWTGARRSEALANISGRLALTVSC